jgi:ribosomal 30S subunit maturation factor RimM
LLDVGRVVKPHGLTGELVVELWTDRTERLASGTALIGAGHEQELVVVSARPHQGRYLVRFEGVIDRSGAEALRNMVLRAPPMAVEGAMWVDELVGARAVTVDGTVLGRVLRSKPTRPATCWCSTRVAWCRCASSSATGRGKRSPSTRPRACSIEG